jgi:DNA-binding NtrC family response regulator
METLPEGPTPVLVVDDDAGLLLSIKATLVSSGMPEPALLSDCRRAMGLIRRHRFHLVLLDLIMPHIGGIQLLQQVKKEFPDIECVIVTAVDEVSSAVEAMSIGAYDYLVKPLNAEKLIIAVSRALERYNLRHELSLHERQQSFSDLASPDAFKPMICEDEAMALVFHQVEAVAPTDYNVVVSGESGTGKEMLSRIIHRLSNRSESPFVAVNMAACSKTLFEDEFFGHARGAYTDAVGDKSGFFEEAQHGSLFLDEVTELEPSLQGKLLRVIEQRELYRLGSTKVRNVDVRIISATNRDINEEIRNGRFRADLFYRLNMCHIKIPPLRERRKDILPLARFFCRKHAEANRKNILSLAPNLMDYLQKYAFPGNVRELENLMASAVLLEKGNVLTLASMQKVIPGTDEQVPSGNGFVTLEEVERSHIQRILEFTGGNRIQAAKILGVNTTTVYRKIEKYGISDKSGYGGNR